MCFLCNNIGAMFCVLRVLTSFSGFRQEILLVMKEILLLSLILQGMLTSYTAVLSSTVLYAFVHVVQVEKLTSQTTVVKQ